MPIHLIFVNVKSPIAFTFSPVDLYNSPPVLHYHCTYGKTVLSVTLKKDLPVTYDNASVAFSIWCISRLMSIW